MNRSTVTQDITGLMAQIDAAARDGVSPEDIAKQFDIDLATVELVLQSTSLLNRLSDPSYS